MITISRLFRTWLTAAFAVALLAQVAFTGHPTSEVPGTMTLAMGVIGLPSSLIAYPLALAAVSAFEPQGLFPHNSRQLLLLWWGVFFALGVVQWKAILWLAARRKPAGAVDGRG